MYNVQESGVLKTVESWIVIVPLHDNDGKPFGSSVIEGVIQELLLNYPGFSLTNSVGYWKGENQTYEDQNYQIVIDVVPDNTGDSSKFFASLKKELAVLLSQEKIYVTKGEAKQELLTFEEFFDEVGVQAQGEDNRSEAYKIAKELGQNFEFVLQRLGYETTALRRNTERNKIVWERKLCGIRLKTEFDDDLPPHIKLVAADQVRELGEALAGEQSFAVLALMSFSPSSYKNQTIEH